MALLALTLVSSLVSAALACNGYELKNFKIEACSGNAGFLNFGNLTPVLRDDCTVIVTGCATLSKDLEWANGTYVAEKKAKLGMPMKFTGEKSMCKLLTDSKDSPEITQGLVMINVEQKCPVKAGKICGSSKSLSLDKYKDYFKMMGGDYESLVKGTSNAGKICLKAKMSIVAKGGAAKGGFGQSMMG